MKAYEAKKMIRDVFENAFNKQKFKYFVKNLLINLEEKTFVYTGSIIPQAYRNVVRKMERIGKFKDAEGNIIDVLIVELKNDHSVEHARTTQRNFIRWYLNGSRGNELKDAALVAFYSENSPDWRFSFIKMQYSLEKQKDEFTPARRSSFLVGKDEKSHTAQKQLLPLLKSGKLPMLYDLEDAFSVEHVTEEFFEQYKTLLFKLKDALDENVKTDDQVRNEFESKNIDTLNFSKKLLGQIVFLYFIQKKGWLGLKNGQLYGQGDRKFLRHLFEQAQKNNKNYYNDFLKYLFYDALSIKRPTDFYPKFNCRIPFLNGGLFDPLNFHDWEKPDLNIPNEIFSNKKDINDEGTGILDVFDLYNFTVKEDEPLETEVAIDPEMLGKIFERLLDVKDRKSKGAFYTPREIVHYMARQSLLYYLDNEGDILSKTDLESFINHTEYHIEKDIAIETGKLSATRNKQQIPETIKVNARRIDEVLAGIKICDPAVGSGAFPVGVMHEVVKLRTLLTPFIAGEKTKRTTYYFKSHAIENSLYGVDIDEGAVEIAKLRLWLSLVVDENNIHEINPLPNLDYKIVRGNSLINIPPGTPVNDALAKEIEKLMKEYYAITDKRIKQEKKQQIDSKIQEQLAFVSEQMKGYKIDFDFELFFHDVFHTKGGFDIVIGNPPYIQLQKALSEGSGQKYADLYKNLDYETFERTGDIYTLFYEKGLKILKNKGILAYITSNKWMRAKYGKSLRKFFTRYKPLLLIDLGSGVFTCATVDTNILIISKEKSERHYLKALILNDHNKIFKLKEDDFNVLNNLSDQSWIILSPIEEKIKERIEQVGTPLKDWNVNINYGIKTGYNEAFIIDGAVKDRLIEQDPKSAEIIKPILRGRDIKRYKVDFADRWLINTHNGYHKADGTYVPPVNVEEYPAIKAHLDQYWPKLVKRHDQGRTPYNLRDCAYMEEFEKEKIVYSEIVHNPQFMLDKDQFYAEATAFLLSGDYLSYLTAMLNSRMVSYAFKTYYAGGGLGDEGYRYKKAFILKLPIPKIPSESQKPFETLVDYIIAAKESGLEETAAFWEHMVDALVYVLYFEPETGQAGTQIREILSALPALPEQNQKAFLQELTDKYKANAQLDAALTKLYALEEVKTVEAAARR